MLSIDFFSAKYERNPAVIYSEEPHSTATPPQKASCCLVVEDNIFAADIMVTFFTQQGFQADTAENGKIALDMFCANPERYGIIFMDLQMPVMNGYEATQMIRSCGCGAGATIPIIAVSGELFHDLSEFGFSGSFRKPFKMQELLPLIQQYCMEM